MKKKRYLKIILVAVTLVILMKFLTVIFVEPWIGKKIEAVVNDKNKDFEIKIDKVHILMIKSGLKLERIALNSKLGHRDGNDVNGEIEFIRLKGINLVKVLFKKGIVINEAEIFNSRISGKFPFSKEVKPLKVSSFSIRIDKIIFDKTNLAIKSPLTAQAYSVKEGFLKIYGFQIEKQDTLSRDFFKQLDFEAEELVSVSADSMYTITASGLNYSATSNTLVLSSFSVQPNYANNDFASRYKYQTDRIEAALYDINIYDFHAQDYIKYKNMESSYIEIGEMDMKVFRDNRKEFQHLKKPPFQNLIYNYPGILNIDSIGIINGNITYTEHVDKASEPGMVSFKKINAKIYKITNDSIYKTENASLEFKADALLMGKGKLAILLKAGIFNHNNTFSVNGKLSGLEAKELNPMLENNAFIYATSGKIETMNFNFTANNTEATGKMTLLYHGLDIAIKNKQTDDTTAIKEQILSLIANIKVIDSNPIQGEKIRVGIIYNERDPERFLFNYCFKSILSGIKSSISDRSKKNKK
jgi:hypothetical protein